VAQGVAAPGAKKVFFCYHGVDEPKVRRVAVALAKKGFVVEPSELLEQGGDRGSRRRGEPLLEMVAEAVEEARAVCLCVSVSFNDCPMCHVAAKMADSGSAPVVPLLVDDAKPARHLGGVAPLLACIDFAEEQAFDLGMMELCEEIGEAQPHTLDEGGFGSFAAPPTIALTDLKGSSASPDFLHIPHSSLQTPPSVSHWHVGYDQHPHHSPAPLSPRSSSQASWEGYDSAFMHGGWHREDESGVSQERGWGALWKAPCDDDEDSDSPEEEQAVALDVAASIIARHVSLATKPLEVLSR